MKSTWWDRLRQRAAPSACVALLAGCATVPSSPVSCEQFDQSRNTMRLDTVYRYSEAETRLAAKSFAPIRKNETIAARWYTLRSSHAAIRPCDYLYLTQDLYLLRRNDVSPTFAAHREFYTADGRLITTKREDLTHQLKKTGYYSAAVPLPIPEQAPAGTYRIVTKLIAKMPDRPEQTLATAAVEFRVQR